MSEDTLLTRIGRGEIAAHRLGSSKRAPWAITRLEVDRYVAQIATAADWNGCSGRTGHVMNPGPLAR